MTEKKAEERAFVVIFHPEMELQGDFIVQELKNAGLDAYLANRSTTGAWGDIEPLTRLEVLVPEEEAVRGSHIIQRFLEERGLVREDELEREAEEVENELEG